MAIAVVIAADISWKTEPSRVGVATKRFRSRNEIVDEKFPETTTMTHAHTGDGNLLADQVASVIDELQILGALDKLIAASEVSRVPASSLFPSHINCIKVVSGAVRSHVIVTSGVNA